MTDHTPARTADLPEQERVLAEMADRIAMLEQDRDRLDRLARSRAAEAAELASRMHESAARARPDLAPPDSPDTAPTDLPVDGQESNLQGRIATLEAERDLLQEALRHQAQELARLRLRPARDNSEIQTLKREIEKLQDRIADVYASTSWRITAPLRWITLRFRRGRG